MSNQRMTGSWGASLPRQPVQAGRGTGSTSDLAQPSGKRPPVVPKVQHDLVAHLQRAFPILEPSIVQLIVDELGEGGISDAVKTLSSLAADAETEAASSSFLQGSTHPVLKQLGSPSSECVDDKVAIDMAITASLADQKVQRSVSNGNLLVETADRGCWDVESGWETVDPAVAAEWGAPPPSQSNTIITGSGSDAWDDVLVQSTSSVPRGTNMPPVQSEGALVASWGTDWTDPVELSSHEGSAKPLSNGEAAAKEPGAQAMAAILGENWAKEPLWSSSAGFGDLSVENRDPVLRRPTVQDVKGKTKVRPYAPRIATGAGKEEGKSPKRPYSPKILIDRKDSETSAVAAHYPLKESLSRETVLETNKVTKSDLQEDGEAETLKQLKAMFPEVGDSVICKAYIDSDSDANRAAEALFQSKEETSKTSEGTAALEVCSSSAPISFEGEPPSSGKPETRLEASVQDNLLHAKDANPAPDPTHNLVSSRQYPNPFTEDDSDSEHATGSQSQLVLPVTTTSSSRGTSSISSAVTSPATSPRSRKKGKKDGRQATVMTSSSGSSDEEAKNTRRDMVDFMVSMLGGSVPVVVVADVIENFEGDFQQSLKCLLSMSAGSEGGLIGEEFGAITDGSDGAGNLAEDLSRPSSDGEEEDPATTLVNIFGADKETIQQVLKEKGGNVGDAATVLMAMFESEAGASSGDDFTRLQHVEDQPSLEEDESEDPAVKINLEQLMAHFPLADEGAVRSLLRINDNSFEHTAKMLYDSGLMPRGLDVTSLSDHQVAQPMYAEQSHFSHHQPFQDGSLVAGTRARPMTPPFGSVTRPPGGYYEESSFHPPRAHLQPLFRAEEFPEIGTELPAFSEAPDERAPGFDSHNSLFLKNRSATNKHWRACQYYFSEAARARANREFSRAEALKEQGRKHKRLAEAANQVASSKIFSEKNKTIRNSVKIDVHGQLVQEALGHVDDHLKSLSNLTTISYLSIITGRGLHSENGKAKILPAVQKYLRDRGYTFYQENPGCIVVDLKAERQVPNSLSSAEDADSRPSSAESYEERPGRLEGAGNGQGSYRKLNLA